MGKHTGPEFDHTLASADGFYIYIESSVLNAQEGWTARLVSEHIHNNVYSCLSFWYHMYGDVNIAYCKLFVYVSIMIRFLQAR
jgi:hypothetical protein